jgi:hypothetical protein
MGRSGNDIFSLQQLVLWPKRECSRGIAPCPGNSQLLRGILWRAGHKVCCHIEDYIVSQPRGPKSQKSLSWKLQNL